ncbi:hypothetical protein HYT02_03250 [Candidatus Gottesmanbacteria bacterium]|nr:hypothetical protein [Candidatus Gottesmanbacteria bacterium]
MNRDKLVVSHANPAEGNYLDQPAQAKKEIEALLPPNLFNGLMGVTFNEYQIPCDAVVYSRLIQKHKYQEFPENTGILEQIKRVEKGKLVLMRYKLPGEDRYNKRSPEKRDVVLLFAGVIEEYNPNRQYIGDIESGDIKLKRGIIIADADVKFDGFYHEGEIKASKGNPFGIRSGKVPVAVITQFQEINLGRQLEGFDEYALYAVMQERVKPYQEEDFRRLKLELYPSNPNLLKEAEANTYDLYLNWIEKELDNRGEDTFRAIEEVLKRQLTEIHERLNNLPLEKEQYLADLSFTKSILDALKAKQKKAPPRTSEALIVSESLKEVFQTHGFELSAINPLFYPYYRQVIFKIAENQAYASEAEKQKHLNELTQSLDATPESIIDTFPEIKYDIRSITNIQAVFTKNLNTFLEIVPEENRRVISRQLKRLYSHYFHPDTTPFAKDITQELFKIGFPQYNILENQFKTKT